MIHPELNIVNVDGSPENALPDDIYVENLKDEIISYTSNNSMFDKVKDFLHI